MSDILERLKDTAEFELPEEWELYASTREQYYQGWREDICTADCGDIEDAYKEIKQLRMSLKCYKESLEIAKKNDVRKKCETYCTYSKSWTQNYPRKCLTCGVEEIVR